MARTARNTLKSWFLKFAKPSASQFASLIDSFFHPDEDTLPMDKVDGLDDALQGINDQIQNLPGGGSTAAGTSLDDANMIMKATNMKAFAEAVDLKFNPDDPPELNPPSLVVSKSVATLQKIGAVLSFDVIATFNRGSIMLNGAKQNDRAGAANAYTFSGTGIAGTNNSTNDSFEKLVNNYTVLAGVQEWGARVAHDAGAQPLTSRGNNFNEPLEAGDIPEDPNFNKTSINGVLPLFGTVGNISPISEVATLYDPDTANNIEMVLAAESDSNKQTFAIPTSWITARALVAVQVLNPLSGNFDYPGGNAAASLAAWTVTDVNHDVNGARNYKQYKHNGSDRGAVTIRLIF